MNELKFNAKTEKPLAVAWLDSLCDALEDKQYIITVKQIKGKRSLSANAYFWTLCDKLAEKLKMSKEDVYRDYIRNIGGNTEYITIQTRAVNFLKKTWCSRGIGWQVETCESVYDGWTDCILYCGSSVFDTETMSRLINLVVQDCDSFGIETLDSEGIERMCAEWKAGRGNEDE